MEEPPTIKMIKVEFSKEDWQQSAMSIADAVNDFLFDSYPDREMPRLFVMGTTLYIPAYPVFADTVAMAMIHTVCTDTPSGLALRIWTEMTNIEGFRPSQLP